MLIYKITNAVNNKVYIGATSMSLKKKQQCVISERHNPKRSIGQAVRNYGIDNFSFQVLEFEPNKKIMYDREQYYIALYDSMDNGYNEQTGGIHCTYSDKTKKKMSDNHRDCKGENNPCYGRSGNKNPMFGKKHTTETREKMRIKRNARENKK